VLLDKRGSRSVLLSYPNAGHAFANEMRPEAFHKESYELAAQAGSPRAGMRRTVRSRCSHARGQRTIKFFQSH
jgi:hypothetical protein